MNATTIRKITLLLIVLLTCAWCPEDPHEGSRPHAQISPVQAPTLSPRVRYQVQRYEESCVFAAFAAVTGIPEQRLTDDFKASSIGTAPERQSVDPALLIRWLSVQGYHFENALWVEHGTTFHGDWRALVQGANVRGVVTSGGHAWVLLSATETDLTVWDPYTSRITTLLYAGVTGIFLPVHVGLEDYDDYEPILPAGNKVITTLGEY